MSQAVKDTEGATTISEESRVQENSKRPVNGKVCKECGITKSLDHFYRNGNRYKNKCKFCTLKERKEYYKNNYKIVRERNNRSVAKYYQNNIKKERKRSKENYYKDINKSKEYARNWRKNNPHLHAAKEGKRRAAKRKAVPAWANMELIKAIYKEASEKGLHVDHIIPLQSKVVCGLHCEDNLQLLTPKENLQKSNHLMI